MQGQASSSSSEVVWDESFIESVAPTWKDYDRFTWDSSFTGYNATAGSDSIDPDLFATRINRVCIYVISIKSFMLIIL